MAAEEFKQLSDKELIAQIVETGETSLFGELYDRYANKVYRKCISMVKNKEDAQDLSHDILVKAFLNISKFAGNSSFSTWVYAITYNQCIDFLRKRQKKRVVEFEPQKETIDIEDTDGIEEKIIFDIEVERLQELMDKVSEDDKAILLMKYQDEMSIEDIRMVLDLQASAVKMRLKRARDRLRKFYEKTYGKR
ncbi:MAG: RNA polymerase sigma factor [Chitinophagales bacterium]